MRPLLVCLVLGGCAAAPLGYQDLSLPIGLAKGPLRADNVVREVALVRHALDTAYGGLGFVPSARWAAMGDKLQAARRARSAEQLCIQLADAFAELPDAHLQARLGGRRCGSSPQRRPQVGASYAGPLSKRPYAMDFLTTGGATYAVLALQALPPHEDAAWRGYEGALQALRDSHGVLVDLRGNQGGDDTRGRELARALIDAPPRTAAVRLHVRETPEAVTLRLNALEHSTRSNGHDRALGPRRRKLQSERDLALAPNAPAWIVETPAPPAPPGDKTFAGPLAILVDAGCASSCETTLQALRAHPRAKVFGEHSGGFVEFGELGLLLLPHSGVELLIPTKHWELPAGVSWERVGIPPDVEIEAGKDAFDAAMAWLRAETPQAKIVSAAEFTVPEGQRKREAERLRALGLRVQGEGPVLEHPFAQPLTRRSYVVPQGWLWRQTPRVVFAPALRADLEVLRTAMERAYGGWPVAEQHGWRWASWFADWQARLDAAGERWLPLAVAFAPVQKLQQHQLDNHTTIPLGLRFGGGSRTARLVDAPLGPCTSLEDKNGRVTELPAGDLGRLPRRARRWDGTSLADVHYLAYPSIGEPPVTIVCGERRISLEPVDALAERVLDEQVRRLSGQSFDRPWLRHLSESVAYLRLPTFSKQNVELARRDRDKWERRSGKETALIVDLRANDGGDADFEALRQWVDERDLRQLVDDDRQHAGSCLYPPLRWGYATLSSSGVQPPLSKELQQGLQAGLDELFRRDDPACRARSVESHARVHYGVRSGPPRNTKPRILVLVDNGCGSDCELMAATLGKLPEATVVGQNTYGVAQFIQPGYSVLPNTRLPFRIALGTSDAYGDGRSFDGHGLDVEVLLDGAAASTDDGLLHLIEVLSR